MRFHDTYNPVGPRLIVFNSRQTCPPPRAPPHALQLFCPAQWPHQQSLAIHQPNLRSPQRLYHVASTFRRGIWLSYQDWHNTTSPLRTNLWPTHASGSLEQPILVSAGARPRIPAYCRSGGSSRWPFISEPDAVRAVGRVGLRAVVVRHGEKQVTVFVVGCTRAQPGCTCSR